jgi:hypothetical protein
MKTRQRPVASIAYPLTRERMVRIDESIKRARGSLRGLVCRWLAEGRDPSPADLAAALRESPPEPRWSMPLEHMTRDAQLDLMTTPARRALVAAELDDEDFPAATEEEYDASRRTALAAAEAAIARDTEILLDYVITRYVLKTKPIRTGRKAPTRSLREEHRIVSRYFRELTRARRAAATDSRAPRGTTAIAEKRTADAHQISARTVRRLVQGVTAT